MKQPLCKICDAEGHYAYQCFKKQKQPIKSTKKLIQNGKHHRKWQVTKRLWFRQNTKTFYICYLCGKAVDRPNITLDHIMPRSNRPDLRYEMSNLAPVHFWCNNQKGSKHGDALLEKSAPLSEVPEVGAQFPE